MLVFWGINFFAQAFDSGMAVFYALMGCYALAFVGVVANYFWARWYAIGVFLFGVIIGVVGLWQTGGDPNHPAFIGVVILGGSHLLGTLSLLGGAMSSVYEGQPAWREKLHMDDSAVHRLGRSVIRAGFSLPIVLAYGLMPRMGGAAAIAVVLATLGTAALIRLRTWGVLALGLAGVATLFTAGATMHLDGVTMTVPAVAVSAVLLAAAAPFVRPMLRSLRGV